MDSLTERIDIINASPLIDRNKNENLEMHRQSNFYLLIVNVILAAIFIIIILIAATTEISGISTRFNWDKTGLILLISINVYNAFGKGLYKNLLLKHLKFLAISPLISFNQKLNQQLIEILASLNRPLWRNIIIGSLMIILLIGCFTNMFMKQQFIYYKFFIIPAILFYTLASYNMWSNYRKLKANLNEVEDSNVALSSINLD